MNQQVLIQKISHKNGDFDLSLVMEKTYIEYFDFRGPVLLLKLNDYHEVFREDLALQEGDEITVFFSDVFIGGEEEFEEGFEIRSIASQGEILTIDCMSVVINKLKKPVQSTQCFSSGDPQTILQTLLENSSLSFEVDHFPLDASYHILMGERATMMLKTMKREKGALCFYSRGKVYFKKYRNLFEEKAELVFHYNDARQRNSLPVYRTISGTSSLSEALEQRHYVGYDRRQGYVSPSSQEYPLQWSFHAHPLCLQNMNVIQKPLYELDQVGGSLMLQAGKRIKINWNSLRKERVTNETMIAEVVIGTVAHHEWSGNYFCKMVVYGK